MRKITFFLALGMAVLFGAQPARARIIDLSTETSGTGSIHVKDWDVLTGTLANPYQIWLGSSESGTTITLNGVTINGIDDEKYKYAGLTINNDPYNAKKVTLILKGTNIISGHYQQYPGIFVGEGSTLTIEGDGTLIVKSNGAAPAIGGAAISGQPGGNIIINGGTIQATGGHLSAAIGGASGTSCGDITINGGTITATGGAYAPGIGGGGNAACGKITINNDQYAPLNLQSKGGSYATYSIGPASDGTCGKITICGKTYKNGVTDSPFTCKSWDGNLANVTGSWVTACNGVTIRGTLSNTCEIDIADGATVNLKDATITSGSAAGLNCMGDAKIVLQGTNTVKGSMAFPGIHVPYGNELIIEGDGALSASSSGHGAGIGGSSNLDCGKIILNGGTITATGGQRCAGIGGGPSKKCGDIAITECVTKVTATKGSDARYSVGAGKFGEESINTTVIINANCETFYGGKQYGGGGIEESPFVYPYECFVPKYLRYSGTIGENSFRVVWSAGGSETQWELRYKSEKATEYSYKDVDNTYGEGTLEGLQAGTKYEVAVRAYCAFYDLWSDWTEPIYVTTKDKPTGLDNAQNDKVQCTKVIRDGQLYIERGGKTYSITGLEVK